jgi:hypothetical protein
MQTIAYTRDGVQHAECPTCLLTLSERGGKFTCPNVNRNATCGRTFAVRDVRGGIGLVWFDPHVYVWPRDDMQYAVSHAVDVALASVTR